MKTEKELMKANLMFKLTRNKKASLEKKIREAERQYYMNIFDTKK